MNKLTKTIMTLTFSSAITAGLISNVDACTRVFLNTDPNYLVSGRNLDFFGPVDPALIITPQGITHQGGDSAEATKWITKYGSVAIYADGLFPMDGVNEKGLAGHTLYYKNGSQVQNNNNKPILESKAWLSYILDNFATVDEAVAAIKNDVRLAAVKLPIDYATDTKHIAIEDVTGDSAIIEIDNGIVNIYHNKNYRVMTNPPSYAEHLKNLEQYKNASREEIPKDYHASDRLIRATFDLNNLPKADNKVQAQGFVLSVLNDVAYPIGIPAGADEQHVIDDYAKYSKLPNNNKGIGTYWTTITDLTNLEYRFKSTFAPSSVWLSLKEINFSQGQAVKQIQHLNDYGKNGWEGNILSNVVIVK